VGSEAELKVLQKELEAEMEAVAIDLEHHSYRSFQGLTCLMQITTSKGHDFLIDCLAPEVRPFIGAALGPILSDETVVKIFHGANSDVAWLQRDFGLYVVNLFDTGLASRHLEYPSASLAYLLERHAALTDVKRMKQKWQMADWRLRPLEKMDSEMLLYARSDTHYLLAVYDRLRAELWDKGGEESLRTVLDASKAICKLTWVKEVYNPDGWRLAIRGRVLSEEAALRAASLWDWRDATARIEDESSGFVLEVRLLVKLAESAPCSEGELRGLVGSKAPPLLLKHLRHVLHLIRSPPSAANQSHPGTKRVDRDGGNIADAKTRRSVFTFTPATASASGVLECSTGCSQSVSQSPLVLGKRGTSLGQAAQGSPSPVLNTEELYRTAGWISPIPFPTLAAHASGEAPSASEAARIRSEIAQQPLLPLLQVPLYTEEKDAANEPGEENDDEDLAKDDLVSRSVEARTVTLIGGIKDADDEAEANDDELEGKEPGVPRSMADIYKISNRNRRRNKEKKKLRESQHGSMELEAGAAAEPAFNYFDGRSKKPRGEAEAQESAVNFLAEMGWAGDPKSVPVSIGHFSDTGNKTTAAANPYLASN